MTDNPIITTVEQLVETYYPSFVLFARSRVQSRHDAEDLAQDIILSCVEALKKNHGIQNQNAYLWSIAHHTLKRWYAKKKWILTEDISSYTNVVQEEHIGLSSMILDEDRIRIRHEILHLSKHIRNTMISFYYDEMTMQEIAMQEQVPLSTVKYYLSIGKSKLKENMMNPNQPILKPEELHLYKSAIDFSRVDLWRVYQRALPRQIALLCHGRDQDITSLSVSTGVPAMYLEEECQLLLESGTLQLTSQRKYRTNFHILYSSQMVELQQLFHELHARYVPYIISRWDMDLQKLRETSLFGYDATEQQYAWFYANQIPDSPLFHWDDNEYPQILSCGSRAFIFASQSKEFPWSMGATPTALQGATIWGVDCPELGIHGNQESLRRMDLASALLDLRHGEVLKLEKEVVAELLQKGFAIRIEEKLHCTIPTTTPQSRILMKQIQEELLEFIALEMELFLEKATALIQPTIPRDLLPYTHGYVKTWVSFLAGVTLKEALYQKGFLKLPKDRTSFPGFSFIYEE